MDKKKDVISRVRREIGWAYSGLKWLTDEEAFLANKQRDAIFEDILPRVSCSFKQNKIHAGELSPGCSICGEGKWSCMFINGLCTADCFYCPQDRRMSKERSPSADGFTFSTPGGYADFLKKFGFKGAGFSGGEPFLVFEKLLTFIEEIRRSLGPEFYLWVYTNGDLVNEDKLTKLKRAGLNEIRFDISARNYDLRPVALAVKMIEAVSVEIPSIPEDCEVIKRCLPEMRAIGVKYLNIHQLFSSEYNYKEFMARGYTFLHRASSPILESEMSALELVKYAIDNQIDLPINYCSSLYKNRLQRSGRRKRFASVLKDSFEDVTDNGYIRSLSIKKASEELKEIASVFREASPSGNLWKLSADGTELFFQGALLRHLDSLKHDYIVRYFDVQSKASLGAKELGVDVALGDAERGFIVRTLCAQQDRLSIAARNLFREMFIESAGSKALGRFYRDYKGGSRESLMSLLKEAELLSSFKAFEWVEEGFQEIY